MDYSQSKIGARKDLKILANERASNFRTVGP